MAELRQIVEPVRIHDRERGRQRFIGEVMIDDDRLHAKPRRFRSGSWLTVPQSTVTSSVAPRPASARIASTFGPYPSNNGRGWWMIGSIPARPGTARASPTRSRHRRRNRRRSRPSRDASPASAIAPPPRPCQAACSDQASACARRVEVAPNLVDSRPAGRQHPRQQVRQVVPLRDRQRPRRAALVQPVAPGAASGGVLDAQGMASLPNDRQRGLDKTDNIVLLCERIGWAIVRN